MLTINWYTWQSVSNGSYTSKKWDVYMKKLNFFLSNHHCKNLNSKQEKQNRPLRLDDATVYAQLNPNVSCDKIANSFIVLRSYLTSRLNDTSRFGFSEE